MVQRSDLAIVVTSVNSHGAMYIAKKSAARAGRRMLITRTCGPSRFSAILQSLESAPYASEQAAMGA
jgi:hypothetical protein